MAGIKLELVANATIAILFSAIAGLIGVAFYYSGVGGFYGIGFAIALTAFLGLGQWYFAPSLIRWITGAEEVSREQAPKIFEIVDRLSKKAGLPKSPKILVVRNQTPNAFAFGRSRKDSNIALHTGLLKVLSPDEAEAVIAHEIGHIRHRDVVIMTIASIIPVLLYYVAIIFLSGSDRDRRGSLGVFAGGFLARFLGQILVLWLSRVREYSADEFASEASSGKSLAKALAKISYGISEGDTNDSISCLYISDRTGESPEALSHYLELDAPSLEKAVSKESRFGFFEAFMSHPLTSKRILALKRLDEKKAKGS